VKDRELVFSIKKTFSLTFSSWLSKVFDLEACLPARLLSFFPLCSKSLVPGPTPTIVPLEDTEMHATHAHIAPVVYNNVNNSYAHTPLLASKLTALPQENTNDLEQVGWQG